VALKKIYSQTDCITWLG